MANFGEKFKKLGKKISEFRKKNGLTQMQFAIQLGITREHLSHIEIGIKRPSLELLFLIAQTLQIEIKELFDFT